MSGGFDATAFGTGLLSGINNRIAAANKQDAENQQYGDRQLIEQFQKQKDEDEKIKQQTALFKQAVDDHANNLASTYNVPLTNGVYTVARDAINQGIADKPEYAHYIEKALRDTVTDEQINPKKYNSPAASGPVYAMDSDPQTAAALQRAHMYPGAQSVEEIRNHINPTPYSNLPTGQWGDITDENARIAEKKTEGTTQGQAEGKANAAISPEGIRAADIKNQLHSGVPSSALIQQNQAQPTTSAEAAPPSSTAVPPPPAGISISGAAPPLQSTQGLGANAVDTGMQQMGGAPQASASQLAPPAQQGQQTNPVTAGAQGNMSAPVAPAAHHQGITSTGPQLNEDELKWFDKAHSIPLDPSKQSILQSLSDGKVDPNFYFKNGANSAMRDALTRYDPTYTDSRYNALKSYQGAGMYAKQAENFNTTLGHFNALRDAAVALGSGNNQLFNEAAMRYKAMTGNPAPTNFNEIKTYLADELKRTYSPTGQGSEKERDAYLKTLDGAQSPQQLMGGFRYATELLHSKIDAIKTNHDRDMGAAASRSNFDTLSPEARDTYTKMQAYTKDGMPATPGGQNVIDILKRNPQMLNDPKVQSDFRDKYGYGIGVFIPGAPK